MGIPIAPAEADSPLIIYPDAVLTSAIATQLLQAIAWRQSQVLD